MRVLHVITALGVGGAERMLARLLGAPALAGFEQQVVAMLPGGAMAAPMRATGAPVHELDFLGGVPLAGGATALARLARRLAPDLVHGWLYHGNLGATLARAVQRRRVPLVWGIRQSLPSLAGENAWARVAIRLNRQLSGRPDRLLFNSAVSLRQHRDFGFDTGRAQVLPNGFDIRNFAPDAEARTQLRAEWGVVEPSAVVFGLLARWHPAKNHLGFLQAAAEVLHALPDAHVVLAGTGVEAGNPALREAAATLGPRAHLLGERHDVPRVLSALDVYVSASTGIEGFSNAVGEAMACGLPCVVTAVGDSPAIVGDTGRVVAPGDVAALAAAMQALGRLPAAARTALGTAARARVVAEYELGAIAARQAAVYRELLAGG